MTVASSHMTRMHFEGATTMHQTARSNRRLVPIGLTACLLLAGIVSTTQARERSVNPSNVCVTNGIVLEDPSGKLVINSASSRAVARGYNDSSGALRFEYLGPTQDETRLASGVMRRQLGIKLRAEDSCNVIYVMWGIEPETGLVVSMKVNEGKSTHAQCGVKGYKLIPATYQSVIAPIKVGEPRLLAATLDEKGKLTVRVDGKVAWEGIALAPASKMFGYTGIRTDNVRMRFEWLADDDDVATARKGARASPKVECRRVEG